MNSILFFFTFIFCFFTHATIAQPFFDCNVEDYYALTDVNDRAALHTLIQLTHRNVLPYTSSSPDAWDALIELDAVDNTNSKEVHLLYSNRTVAAEPHGTSDTWNREHVWPKSLGVGTSGADYTDVHHLKPSDANVNSARGNKLFGECGIADVQDDCVSPGHAEAASDTETDNVVWLPPKNKRGDVARMMFYMDVRYDGDATNELDLQLTDCVTNPDLEMGYLSQLLQWHIDDAVDDAERVRNQQVCENWQGNRNPFVDYEELASIHFGMPREPDPPLGYTCNDDATGGGDDTSPTPSPTPTSAFTEGTCNGLQPGDVMISALISDNPDAVAIAVLNDVKAGATLYMTDNAWTGTKFRDNEGTLKFVVPSGGIPANTAIGYGDSRIPHSDKWSIEAGSFALAAAGDTIIFYCIDAADDSITHLTALSYSGDWLPASQDESTFDTDKSALPASLPPNTHVALPHFDNYEYVGPQQGSSFKLQEYLSNPSNWQGSNTPNWQGADSQMGTSSSSFSSMESTSRASVLSGWMPIVGTALASIGVSLLFHGHV